MHSLSIAIAHLKFKIRDFFQKKIRSFQLLISIIKEHTHTDFFYIIRNGNKFTVQRCKWLDIIIEVSREIHENVIKVKTIFLLSAVT